MRNLMFCFAVLLIAAVTSSAQKSPVIVKQVALTNQTQFIKPTKLITPSSDALYRVSAYFEVTSNVEDNGELFFLKIGWTDATEKGAHTKSLEIFDYGHGTNNSNQITFIASDIAGEPLGFSVTDQFGLQQPPVPFNVYITVEQLQ